MYYNHGLVGILIIQALEHENKTWVEFIASIAGTSSTHEEESGNEGNRGDELLESESSHE